MVLYELVDLAFDNTKGWLNHLAGLSRLMQHRGPTMYKNAAAIAIFEHSRYLLMLQHLLARKASVFSQPAWLNEPWQDVDKSVEQSVFDNGLRLAALFERCDVAAQRHSEVSEAIELFGECTELYDRLQILHQEHIAPGVAVAPLPVAASSGVANPAAFMLSITALGIQLGAYGSACDILRRVIEPSITALEISDTNSESVRIITQRTSHLIAKRRALAQLIIRSVELCSNEGLGAMGAARVIFSLQLAKQQFQPAEPEFERCQILLRRLDGRTTRFESMLRSNRSSK